MCGQKNKIKIKDLKRIRKRKWVLLWTLGFARKQGAGPWEMWDGLVWARCRPLVLLHSTLTWAEQQSRPQPAPRPWPLPSILREPGEDRAAFDIFVYSGCAHPKPLTSVSYKSALALGARHLPLQGLNHELLKCWPLAPWKEFRVEGENEALYVVGKNWQDSSS